MVVPMNPTGMEEHFDTVIENTGTQMEQLAYLSPASPPPYPMGRPLASSTPAPPGVTASQPAPARGFFRPWESSPSTRNAASSNSTGTAQNCRQSYSSGVQVPNAAPRALSFLTGFSSVNAHQVGRGSLHPGGATEPGQPSFSRHSPDNILLHPTDTFPGGRAFPLYYPTYQLGVQQYLRNFPNHNNQTAEYYYHHYHLQTLSPELRLNFNHHGLQGEFNHPHSHYLPRFPGHTAKGGNTFLSTTPEGMAESGGSRYQSGHDVLVRSAHGLIPPHNPSHTPCHTHSNIYTSTSSPHHTYIPQCTNMACHPPAQLLGATKPTQTSTRAPPNPPKNTRLSTPNIPDINTTYIPIHAKTDVTVPVKKQNIAPYETQNPSPPPSHTKPTTTPPGAPPARRSEKLSPTAVTLMESWYRAHFDHPYPDHDVIETLARAGDVTASQVKKWMANKRVRSYNTLSFNGSVHPKRRRRMERQQQVAKATLVHVVGHQGEMDHQGAPL